MLLVIRISGQVDISSDIREGLDRIKLQRKYVAVVLHENKELMSLLVKLRNHVSYGEIKKETLVKLIKARGKPLEAGKKIDAEKIADELEKKSLSKVGLKPFFRLHPPRGGIDSKKHAGVSKKAVLGHNKNINELVERML